MNSFDEMSRLFREMDRAFDRFRSARLHEFTTPGHGRGLESDGRVSDSDRRSSESEADRTALESDETAVDGTGVAFRSHWPAFGTGTWAGIGTSTGAAMGEAATLEDEGDAYVFVMDLAGFETDAIDLGYDDGVLTIAARADVEDGSDAYRSVRSRRVARRIPIPTEIVADEITATYRNGVLEVRLPMAEGGDDGHRIEIE